METILERISGATAIAYVSMLDSQVLASHALHSDVADDLKSIALTGIEMFSGHHVVMLEDKLKDIVKSDRDLGHYFDTLMATGDGINVIYMRDPDDTERFVMVLADPKSNTGMMTVQLRSAMSDIRALA